MYVCLVSYPPRDSTTNSRINLLLSSDGHLFLPHMMKGARWANELFNAFACTRERDTSYLSRLRAKGRVRIPVERLPKVTRKSGSRPSARIGVSTTMYAAPASCTATIPNEIAASSHHRAAAS